MKLRGTRRKREKINDFIEKTEVLKVKNLYEIRGGVTAIFLKKRNGETYETIIDTSDLPKAMSFKGNWNAGYSMRTKTHYVLGYVDLKIKRKGRRSTASSISLHRFLYDFIPEGLVIDHKNHDTLDNRRSVNLRIVTNKENNQNKRSKKKVI